MCRVRMDFNLDRTRRWSRVSFMQSLWLSSLQINMNEQLTLNLEPEVDQNIEGFDYDWYLEAELLNNAHVW